MKKFAYLLFSLLILNTVSVYAKVVKYQFDINTKTVNFSDKKVEALSINNQIPGPTIEATIDDTLEVTFHNKMATETSIHWHGILLPNDQDGVPYLTTQPIAPHSSFTYKYKITHHGTYWYHSHTGLQEQRGIYGSLVFHPKEGERVKSEKDYVVVLSDWTNENPNQVLANLKKDGDYYALKKKSVQSWDKVLSNGKQAIKNRLQGAWSRMGPMDLSDVGYDAFLSNGKKEELLNAKKGDKVRIRLINAAASSYFNVEFAGASMTIVAADGVDVEPLKVKRLRIAIAETYDVIVHVQENKSYELRSSSEDGTGYSSTFIGSGEKVFAPDISRPNLFLTDHNMHDMSSSGIEMSMDMKSDKMMNHSMHSSSEAPAPVSILNSSNGQIDHSKMGHDMGKMSAIQNPNKSSKPEQNVIEHMKDYENLRAVQDTSFDPNKPSREVILNLTGNMERYVWSFNNKTLSESDKIMIKHGEVITFILQNQTMMHHPIHLHGHFFRVINKQGKRSPLKHTVNVPPMGKVIIEFDATEEKDWFFHCHNLYHMKAGMARVISYERTTKATPETFAKIAHDDWYFRGDISALSNMSMGMLKASNSRNSFEIEYDSNYKKTYDAEVIYARSITRFLDIYAGGNFEREDKDEKAENTGVIGIRYVLYPSQIKLRILESENYH
jgi:CopA family copper-resistance protein